MFSKLFRSNKMGGSGNTIEIERDTEVQALQPRSLPLVTNWGGGERRSRLNENDNREADPLGSFLPVSLYGLIQLAGSCVRGTLFACAKVRGRKGKVRHPCRSSEEHTIIRGKLALDTGCGDNRRGKTLAYYGGLLTKMKL